MRAMYLVDTRTSCVCTHPHTGTCVHMHVHCYSLAITHALHTHRMTRFGADLCKVNGHVFVLNVDERIDPDTDAHFPAMRAGLSRFDEITHLGEEDVRTQDLPTVYKRMLSDDKVRLSVVDRPMVQSHTVAGSGAVQALIQQLTSTELQHSSASAGLVRGPQQDSTPASSANSAPTTQQRSSRGNNNAAPEVPAVVHSSQESSLENLSLSANDSNVSNFSAVSEYSMDHLSATPTASQNSLNAPQAIMENLSVQRMFTPVIPAGQAIVEVCLRLMSACVCVRARVQAFCLLVCCAGMCAWVHALALVRKQTLTPQHPYTHRLTNLLSPHTKSTGRGCSCPGPHPHGGVRRHHARVRAQPIRQQRCPFRRRQQQCRHAHTSRVCRGDCHGGYLLC